MTNKEIGNFGEDKACEFLENNGISVIKRNYHARMGEIDIIAKDGDTIVFVEVKTRSVDQNFDSSLYSPPSKAVTKTKQKHLIDAAMVYLKASKSSKKQPRMDVIEVLIDKNTKDVLSINHIRNAYGLK